MRIRRSRLVSTGLLACGSLPFALAQVTPPAVPATALAVADPADAALPQQAPTQPPKVICSGEQLTISANNSTLESILVMVRGCSGAKIDIPEGAAHVRAFEELGPGPIRKVLDDLLSATDFNYVILSYDAAPQRIQSVMLTSRKKDSGPVTSSNTLEAPSTEIAMTPARKKWLSMQKFDKPDPSSPDADPRTLGDGGTGASAAVEIPVTAGGQDLSKAENTAEVAPPSPPPAESVAVSTPVKVTEDKITSMQQLFDQRREMIQKQTAPIPPAQNATPN